ncbi:GAF domain-containing protein [Haloarcula salinisoli]|uniref:GAF domain-containing protein n=1 Tax=Haloarcula salinisoli TaxID=2487746 RepID=A0A8J7YIX0_9EURY|nr:GAF domain-containing protein [Halomicroarcula salinisoli]MBX0286854.1 GAF domain-containing protein [Halomicroarcula salinisoli]MBX0304156.1 GAF domain-containing protein [Halomicroarcula salinisoli]
MDEITTVFISPEATADTSPLRELISDPDISVYWKTTVEEAKAFIADTLVDCVVTAYDLPDGTGIDVITHLRETSPDTGAILVTDVSLDQVTEEASPGLVLEFVPGNQPATGARVVQLVKSTAENRSQTSYPVPPSETERLEVLESYNLNDERFVRAVGRISDLAADHFEAPYSSVAILTERTQEILACTGTSWDRTPREGSVCTYTILHDGVSVVEDTLADPRFEATIDSDDGDIRFYAGATINTSEGYPVGTVCIYDEEPRPFTESDREFLSLLAAEVMDWLEVVRHPREVEAPSGGVT